MNDKGYLLIEVLFLIVILILIMNIFLPILNTIIGLIKINNINDFENEIILNVLESIKTGVDSEENIEAYDIDISHLISICHREKNYTEDFQIYKDNEVYILNIKKEDIDLNLWGFEVGIKENRDAMEGKNKKARIVIKKPK